MSPKNVCNNCKTPNKATISNTEQPKKLGKIRLSRKANQNFTRLNTDVFSFKESVTLSGSSMFLVSGSPNRVKNPDMQVIMLKLR